MMRSSGEDDNVFPFLQFHSNGKHWIHVAQRPECGYKSTHLPISTSEKALGM